MNPIRLSESDIARLFGSANPLAPLKGSGRPGKAKRAPDPARQFEKARRAIAWAKEREAENPGPASIFVAARLPNHANGAQGGKGRRYAIARERRDDRAKTYAACAAGRVVRSRFPVRVRMVRLGAGTMDVNGLWNALKSVMDGVADYFGPKDNDPRYQWDVAQERAPRGCYGARIEFSYPSKGNAK